MQQYLEANQPCSAKQIAQALGVTRQAVYEQHEKKAMHVEAWGREPSGHAVALYVLGPGKDVRRPASRPQSVRSKAYWENNRAAIRARRPPKRLQALGVWAALVS